MRCRHQSGPDACSQLHGSREEGPSSAHPDEGPRVGRAGPASQVQESALARVEGRKKKLSRQNENTAERGVRTLDLRISQVIQTGVFVYETYALTNCATSA
jgi:hypothetical protein